MAKKNKNWTMEDLSAKGLQMTDRGHYEKAEIISNGNLNLQKVKVGRKPHEQVQMEIHNDRFITTLKIKPLSINDCFQGRRFRTPEYDAYERKVMGMLKDNWSEQAPYKLAIEFGFSNPASDLDNPCKPLIDILQKKYKFNDKHITELHVKKVIVPKGREYIKFSLTTND